MNTNHEEMQQNDKAILEEMDSLNLDSLDVEELENRLELANFAALPPDGCWIFGEF